MKGGRCRFECGGRVIEIDGDVLTGGGRVIASECCVFICGGCVIASVGSVYNDEG